MKILPPKIYLIPGLGFDDRFFSRLQLNSEHVTVLNWIEPRSKETIEKYAMRMALGIKLDQHPRILIGHSFGGIMAQEIATHITIQKIILVSSIKSPKENPRRLKWLAPLQIHRIFTKELTLSTFPFWRFAHGYETKEEQDVFKNMVKENSNNYLQWALQQVSSWEGVTDLDAPVKHFHGKKDTTFPARLIKEPVTFVEGGTHIMLFNKAAEMSRLINNEIAVAENPISS